MAASELLGVLIGADVRARQKKILTELSRDVFVRSLEYICASNELCGKIFVLQAIEGKVKKFFFPQGFFNSVILLLGTAAELHPAQEKDEYCIFNVSLPF